MASPLLILRDMLMSRSSQLITSLQSTFNATHRALAIATTLGLAFAIYQWRKPQSASKQTSLSTSHATPPLPCRYNTSNSTSSTITLPDGRKLGYAQYGASAGRPIFFLHGLATTRIDAAAYDEVAKELNVRIIAPDRPGTGLSSPQPGRTLLDYPKDIDMLATYLGISEYGILVSQHALHPTSSLHTLATSQQRPHPPNTTISGLLRRRLPRPGLRPLLPIPPPPRRHDPLWPRAPRHRHARHELVQLPRLHARLPVRAVAVRLGHVAASLCSSWFD